MQRTHADRAPDAPAAGRARRAAGSRYSAADAEKRRGVRRMKTIATGLLLLVALVYVPRQMGEELGGGRLAGLCGGGRRGGHGRCAGGLVRRHRALQASAGSAHPAHRHHSHQEGPAGPSLGDFVGENFLSGDVVRAGCGGRHQRPARRLARRARARRPGHRGAVHRAARRADRAAGLRCAGGRRRGDHPAGGRPGDRAGHRHDAGADRRPTAATGGWWTWCAAGPRLAGRARRLGDGRRPGRRAGMDAAVRRPAGSATGSTRNCCGSSRRCGTCPSTRRAARWTVS